MRRSSLGLAASTDFRLYHVTDSALSGGLDAVPSVAAAAVRGGAGVLQLRDKDATDADISELVRACRTALVAELGRETAERFPLFVNDRLAVAAELGCHLHLGQDDVPVGEARAALGEQLMIGLSASTVEQTREALAEGAADVLGIGPIVATGTKPDAAAPLGLEGLDACLAAWPRDGREGRGGPLAPAAVAIGGIGPGNAADIAATGVDGICVVSAIATAEQPDTAAAALRAAAEAGRHRPQGSRRRAR